MINPLKGFVKDDTIILRARLVYPGPDAHADPAPSSSQSHSIPSLSTSSPSAQPNSQNHTHSPRHAHSGTSSQPTLLPLIKPLSLSLSTPALSPRTFSLSQSSQDSEGSQLTPTSMSVLPPEMAAFLSCPRCSEHYEEEGRRSPNTLHCGHTFCLGVWSSIFVFFFLLSLFSLTLYIPPLPLLLPFPSLSFPLSIPPSPSLLQPTIWHAVPSTSSFPSCPSRLSHKAGCARRGREAAVDVQYMWPGTLGTFQ